MSAYHPLDPFDNISSGLRRRLKLPPNDLVTAEDRQLRLPWWGVLCVICGTVLLGLLFLFFKRFDLARPSLTSIAVIGLVGVMRWKLR